MNPGSNVGRELSREERRLAKIEKKRIQQAAQAAVVRVVNQAEDYPHIIMRQSVWWIANPRNGTQFVKAKRMKTVPKPIYGRDGKVVQTISKTHVMTDLAMKCVDEKTGEAKLLFPLVVKVDAEGRPVKKGPDGEEPVGFDKLTWPVPKGWAPVIVKNSNFIDVPPDAANLVFNGEYRGPNPLTQQRDLRYHDGDLVPLSLAHDMASAIYSGKSADLAAAETRQAELYAENERLEKAIAAKMKELDAVMAAELLEKRKQAALGGATTPDSPGKPSK